MNLWLQLSLAPDVNQAPLDLWPKLMKSTARIWALCFIGFPEERKRASRHLVRNACFIEDGVSLFWTMLRLLGNIPFWGLRGEDGVLTRDFVEVVLRNSFLTLPGCSQDSVFFFQYILGFLVCR